MNAASRSAGGLDGKRSSGAPVRVTPFLSRTALYLCLLIAVVISAYAVYGVRQEQAAAHATEDRLVAYHGLLQGAKKRLAPEYKDADGNLLADAVSDPKHMLDPQTLVVAHYIDADADTQLVDWAAFESQLAKATGKQVVSQEYLNSADDVAAIKGGTIHVAALHSADAPYVVNNAGFVPIAVLGTEAGAHGNHLAVAVPAKSSIKTLADLRGHSLTCTVPDSITGYRAAISVLAEKTGMRPDVDYLISFSHGQKRSVLGVASGEYQAAALSDDKLQSMLKKESVDPADIRVIYESEVIPRLTIGFVFNLKPELAAQVTAAALEFANERGAPDEGTGKPMRFRASDYKKDFEFVRKIDDSFDPRFHKRPTTILPLTPPPPQAAPEPDAPAEADAAAPSVEQPTAE